MQINRQIFHVLVAFILFLGMNTLLMAQQSHKTTPAVSQDGTITKEYTLPKFDSIRSKSTIDVQIITNQKKQSVVAIGNEHLVQGLRTRVRKGTLNLSLGIGTVISHHGLFSNLANTIHTIFHPASLNKRTKKPSRILVIIKMDKLHKIYYSGRGYFNVFKVNTNNLQVKKRGSGTLVVTGSHVGLNSLANSGPGNTYISNVNTPSLVVTNTSSGNLAIKGKRVGLRNLMVTGSGNVVIGKLSGAPLKVAVRGNSHTYLNGVAKLTRLNTTGNGMIRVYWVNSKHLSVNEIGKGTIELAGTCKVLHANIKGNANFDSRYLRANTGLIKTRGFATAHVWASDYLAAWAKNHSNIYYYSRPRAKTVVRRQSGAVLSMKGIPSALSSFDVSL